MTVNESSPDSNNYVLMPSKNPDEPTGMYMCTKHRVNGEYVDDETYNASLHNKDQQLQIIKQHLANFSATLKELKEKVPKDNRDRIYIELKIDSLESFIEEFQEDIADYESKQQGG